MGQALSEQEIFVESLSKALKIMSHLQWILPLGVFVVLVKTIDGSFGTPASKEDLLKSLYGNPCDCKGGMSSELPPQYGTGLAGTSGAPSGKPSLMVGFQQTDGGSKVAHLAIQVTSQHGKQTGWKCYIKPKIVPCSEAPSTCPRECTTYYTQMHSSCYTEVRECLGPNNQTYFTATLQRLQPAAALGQWSTIPQTLGPNKYLQASCTGMIGKPVCWSQSTPIHVSDRGGPQDSLREHFVGKRLQESWARSYI